MTCAAVEHPLPLDLGIGVSEHFDLDELLSVGPEATVWRGWDQETRVAVKVVTRRRSFDDRAIATTRLGHPNLVRVRRDGRLADGRPWAMLDEIKSVRLRRFMRGALERRDVAMILSQLARALAFAHDDGVAHGRLTPEHVLLASGTEAWCQVHLLGLGTSSDALASPYAAPEQLAGCRADALSDVFAYAALAVEMLTGLPRDVGRTPVELRPILRKALGHDPTKRPSLHELAHAIAGGPVSSQ